MKPLTEKENNDLLDMAKNEPIKFYQRTIDSLLMIHDEDKLAIYTLLGVINGYINGVDYSEKDINYHRLVVKSIFDDYDIDSILDLDTKRKECAEKIITHKLFLMKQTGGIQ